jgi:hypothetical protein
MFKPTIGNESLYKINIDNGIRVYMECEEFV